MLFSEDEVFKALSLIDPSKACGPDCIPGGLLKEGAPWLSEPLVALFNQSLKSEFVMLIEDVYDLSMHQTLHDLHHNAGKTHRSIVPGVVLTSLLVHRSDIVTDPVSR